MNENPYEAPKANTVLEAVADVPTEIKKKIKNAWIAGLISIAITLIIILISFTGTSIMGINYTGLLDVVLMSIFVFGIYKNSRVCAILMLLLFLVNKILMLIQSGSLGGSLPSIPLALLFLWFYTQGVIGTFQYHAYLKNSKSPSM